MTGLSFTELRAVYQHARDTWRANRHDVHTIRDYWPECVRQAIEEKAERADDLQPVFGTSRRPTPASARERARAMLGLPATGLAMAVAAGADARPAFAAEENLARVMSGLRARFMLDERAVHEFAVHLSYTGPTYAEALARIEDALAHPGFDRDALATLRERLEQVAAATPAPAFTVTNSTGLEPGRGYLIKGCNGKVERIHLDDVGPENALRVRPLSEARHNRDAERLRSGKPSQLGRGHKNKYAARPLGSR